MVLFFSNFLGVLCVSQEKWSSDMCCMEATRDRLLHFLGFINGGWQGIQKAAVIVTLCERTSEPGATVVNAV